MLLQLLLSASLAVAAQPVLKIDGKRIDVVEIKSEKLIVSRRCKGTVGVAERCEAIRAVRRASYSKAAAAVGGFQDGANPGSLICENVGGEVAMAVDEKGNEQSFCRFGDGTLVDGGSLHYHSMINDDKKVENER